MADKIILISIGAIDFKDLKELSEKEDLVVACTIRALRRFWQARKHDVGPVTQVMVPVESDRIAAYCQDQGICSRTSCIPSSCSRDEVAESVYFSSLASTSGGAIIALHMDSRIEDLGPYILEMMDKHVATQPGLLPCGDGYCVDLRRHVSEKIAYDLQNAQVAPKRISSGIRIN